VLASGLAEFDARHDGAALAGVLPLQVLEHRGEFAGAEQAIGTR
jgi:hypothetical protein